MEEREGPDMEKEDATKTAVETSPEAAGVDDEDALPPPVVGMSEESKNRMGRNTSASFISFPLLPPLFQTRRLEVLRASLGRILRG